MTLLTLRDFIVRAARRGLPIHLPYTKGSPYAKSPPRWGMGRLTCATSAALEIHVQKSKNGERGQSLIEIAVALPVILLILLGTFDFGMALFSYSIMRDAAQEGALYGSINPGNKAEIENRARNILPRDEGVIYSSPVDLRDDSIAVDIKTLGGACQGISGSTANRIQVRLSYQYPILTPFVSEITGTKTIQLSSTATNVILQPPCN